MLAKYNLNVGDYQYPNELTYGIQDENVFGDKKVYTTYGPVKFSTTNYWSSTVSSYPAYVYNENSNLYQYVRAYATYLKNNLEVNSAVASLMSYEQAINLGWVHSLICWLGSAIGSGESSGVWIVAPYNYFDGYTHNNVREVGVRPVITIPISNIKVVE